MAIDSDGAYTQPPPDDPIVSVVVRKLEIDFSARTAAVTVVYHRQSEAVAKEEVLIVASGEFATFAAATLAARPRKKVIAALVDLNRLPHVVAAP